MADRKDVLEALRRGLITDEQARQLLAGRDPDALPEPGAPTEAEIARQQAPRQETGAFEAAGDAFRRVTGPNVGLDPSTFRSVSGALSGLPDPLRRAGVAVAETGAQIGDVLAGTTTAGLSLAGDVAAGLFGGDVSRARRDFQSVADLPFTGAPLQLARLPQAAARTQQQAQALQRGREVIQEGAARGVPVLTTDVVPPRTAAGRLARTTGENVPFRVGTGPARAAQQEARQSAIQEIIGEFGVSADAPLEARIIQGLGEEQKRAAQVASRLRNSAVERLQQFGPVTTENTTGEIAVQIAREGELGARANQNLINILNDTNEALEGSDFQRLVRLRTRINSDIDSIRRGQNAVLGGEDAAALQKVKSAIDADIRDFSKANDPSAGADFVRSSKLFAEEFGKFKRSELRRVLADGQLTPERVAPILRGGKPSELQRLAANAGPTGRANARAAILRDAIAPSGFEDLNPDRILNALNRPNTQKAIDAFFKGQDKKQLDGLVKLLEATRQAQRAGATGVSGQQLLPVVTGGAGVIAPLETFLGVGGVGAAARAYESKAMRDFLLRAANAPKNSRDFRRLSANFNATLADILAAAQTQSAAEIATEQ